MLLTGQVALVTGGGRGIGRAIAHAYAREGAKVAVCARTESEIAQVACDINDLGAQGFAVAGDVSDAADSRRIVAAAERALGPIGILANNAGIFWVKRLLDVEAAELDKMLAVNVRGVMLMMQAVLPGMLERDRGTILNISSLAGRKGYAEQSAYCASKHAVLGMTKALAFELEGSGVRVSALCPGGVDTGMIASARPDLDRSTWMDADDIARLAVLMSSLPPKVAIDELVVRRSASAPTGFT